MYKNARKVARDDHANNIQSMICRDVEFGKGPGAMLPPDFDRSVNPISKKGGWVGTLWPTH